MPETYQTATQTGILETYEWDNIWFEHAEDVNTPRVLVIGDSISCGYRPKLNARLGNATHVDALGSSRAVDNPWFHQILDLILSQRSDYKAVIFNNGLHGFHLEPAAFEAGFAALVDALRKRLPQAKLILPLITPVRRAGQLEEMDARMTAVQARNAAICRIAERRGLTVCDLHTPLLDQPAFYRDDGVHLQDAGYALLADLLAQAL